MISSCTIDFYHRWPEEALFVVANSYLGEKVNLENREVNVCSSGGLALVVASNGSVWIVMDPK
jgi:hypothetical protein